MGVMRRMLLKRVGDDTNVTRHFPLKNKVVNDKQMTVIWYVDDLNFSHIDENENTKFSE